jgi:hypothetical protein
VLKTTRPDIVHAHDSRGVALAATALVIAAPKPKPPLIAARRSSFSHWKYSQVDWFIATSDTVHERLVRAGVAASHGTVVTPDIDIDIERVECSAVTNVHGEFWLPTHAPVNQVALLGALRA